MVIDNRYDEEDVDGATSFQKGEITHLHNRILPTTQKLTGRQSTKTRTVKSTSQVLPTGRQAYQEAIYRDTLRDVDRDVYLVDHNSAEAACRERNHEIDRRVTKADFD